MLGIKLPYANYLTTIKDRKIPQKHVDTLRSYTAPRTTTEAYVKIKEAEQAVATISSRIQKINSALKVFETQLGL